MARSRNTGNNRTNASYNRRLDNNRCHTLRTDSLHIPPRKLPRGLRKGSIVILECDVWISLSFSSDTPFVEFPFSNNEPFHAALSGLLFPCEHEVFRLSLYDSNQTA